MGWLGPSKRELRAEIEKAVAEKDKVISDLHEWKRTTLDPKFRELNGIIDSQKSALQEMGALDYPARLERLEELKTSSESLERSIAAREASARVQLQREAEATEAERIKQAESIQAHLVQLKRQADEEYRSYRAEYDSSYSRLTAQFEKDRVDARNLRNEIVGLKATKDLQDIGLFEYDNPAKNSVQLGAELERVRTRIKAMLKDSSAATVIQTFTFNGSQSKGKRFANDMRKLMLRAYNAEAENAIKSVKLGNSETAIKRMDRTRETAQALGQFIELTITEEFHRLRIQEIELAAEHLKVLQQEKELERERKAQLREEAKVEAEIKKERQAKEAEQRRVQKELEELQKAAERRRAEKLEKERDHYLNVADSLELQADDKKLEEIREKLKDTERALKELDYREANARAGYVYVLSNIGAFGQEIVKIGMTRRLEPKDRVKELSGASVPFVFDTHLMVFSDNARELEHKLHKRFSAARVNKVNPRKEYFYATPEAVLEVLKEMDVAVVEFTKEAEATEYREGLVDSATS